MGWFYTACVLVKNTRGGLVILVYAHYGGQSLRLFGFLFSCFVLFCYYEHHLIFKYLFMLIRRLERTSLYELVDGRAGEEPI